MTPDKGKKPIKTFIVMGALTGVVIIILVIVYVLKIPFLQR